MEEDINKIMIELYITLKEVIQELYDDCEKDPILAEIIAYIREKFSSHNELLNALASCFEHIIFIPVIYGKDTQSGELKQILQEEFAKMYFDNEGSSLYYYSGNVRKYTDVYIKRENYWQAIEGVKEELKKLKKGLL